MSDAYVSQTTIEAVIDRLDRLTPAEIQALQTRALQRQPELSAFVLAYTEDVGEDGAGLALYVTLVLSEAFRASFRDECERLGASANGNILTAEGEALRYVFAALTDDDPSDAVRLTDEEFWHLLAVLKTVVETLHEVSEPAR
jgi:hypothetical protein